MVCCDTCPTPEIMEFRLDERAIVSLFLPASLPRRLLEQFNSLDRRYSSEHVKMPAGIRNPWRLPQR